VRDAGPAQYGRVNPDLAAARAQVLADIAAQAGPAHVTLRPPALDTDLPQYQLGAALGAKIEARVQAGQSAEGGDYPRGQLIPTVVAPTAALALLDAGIGLAALITWLATDWHHYLTATIAVLCALGFIALTATGLAATHYASRDPLRLSKAERRELNRSRHWQSPRPWAGPLAATEQRRLVDVATAAAGQASETHVWTTTYLDDQGIRINLAAEVDAIDEQAFALAQLNVRLDTATAPSGPHLATRDQSWTLLVDRCAALVHYARQLAALDERPEQSDPALDAEVAQVLVGSIRDAFATERTLGITTTGISLQKDPR
jgi:hypothetical protein